VSEVRKRLLALAQPPPLWFWRTAHGDDVDLLIEIGPGRFVAVECKTVERIGPAALKGLRRLTDEYGAAAVPLARVVCRTERAYPLEGPGDWRAVPVAGRKGLVAELADRLSSLDGGNVQSKRVRR